MWIDDMMLMLCVILYTYDDGFHIFDAHPFKWKTKFEAIFHIFSIFTRLFNNWIITHDTKMKFFTSRLKYFIDSTRLTNKSPPSLLYSFLLLFDLFLYAQMLASRDHMIYCWSLQFETTSFVKVLFNSTGQWSCFGNVEMSKKSIGLICLCLVSYTEEKRWQQLPRPPCKSNFYREHY